ncbi:MAG: LuxR family transcriptional regulator [Chloroflexi bacterium HGW-Chloroflexi-10]|nr:MAG: LuxR family transcriptional regulator [Chloroflexi bacterium HGW-Chloroflexi-10]
MSDSLLLTKLYVPPPRSNLVLRPRLLELLNEGLSSGRKLTLISAPAGFGKTTLVSEWVASPRNCPPRPVCGSSVAWLSLDEADNDPARFISYLIAALQTVKAGIGMGLMAALQSAESLNTKALLSALLNEITTIPDDFILILDDYHLIDSPVVDQSLAFLVEHQPSQMHMVISTREDPSLPLARLRARSQMIELRASDLRFTPAEASEFLNQVMGLTLSVEDITSLETRTEGWIAGLQLAAISMHGQKDASGFIQAFTGSHRYILDYLLEEVLQRQPIEVQNFLLQTSILERMCGPLCDAFLDTQTASGQETLTYLERANLFIVSLDDERYWYRYHHLFGDLLRKRLKQNFTSEGINNLQIHASEWYEKNGLILEAFKHAVAANDVDRANRLMEDKKMPLRLPGVPLIILNWLESLPKTLLNANPALWWKQAAMLLESYQIIGVEEKLQAAEAALALKIPPNTDMDEWSRNLVGKIAVARAELAATLYQAETSLGYAQHAMEYLHPNNTAYRSSATQYIGFAHYIQGDRDAAEQAYIKSLSLAQAAGDNEGVLLANTRLGQIHELRNQLHQAAEKYQRALQLTGEDPIPFATVVYLGLARIYFEWNDLDTAEKYGELSYQLARLCDQVVDRLILSQLFMSKIKLTRGDLAGAASFLLQAEQNTRQWEFAARVPTIAIQQVLIHLCQGNIEAAAQIAQQNDLTLLQARTLIAQGDPTAALAILAPYRQQMEEKSWENNQLATMVLQALALHLKGEKEPAYKVLSEALSLAEPGGFIRLFVENGEPMRLLILDYRAWIENQPGVRIHPLRGYVDKLLAAFTTTQAVLVSPIKNSQSELIEPLSQRELEVLQLICQGLSNHEICKQLYLALDTVKGHNRRIFEKLQVHRRTEAIARARELNLF